MQTLNLIVMGEQYVMAYNTWIWAGEGCTYKYSTWFDALLASNVI